MARIYRYVAVRVYTSPLLHRQLKSKLALKGISMSEWFRNKAQEEIDSDD